MSAAKPPGERARRGTDDSNPFVGTWRIVEMEMWGQEDLDLVGVAHFTFGNERMGDFCFVAVEGGLDCRYAERDGKPLVEFTWFGFDDNDPSNGRGWAVLDGDALTGRIFIHCGDDSAFTARRGGNGQSVARRRTRSI